MKVNCENCKKPITSQVNALFEQFEPGSVVCPHCHHQQKRYVSEADLLIYFCFSAVLYSAVLVLIFFLLNWKMQAWVLILAVILFVITYIAMKYGSAQLYEKAYFKRFMTGQADSTDLITAFQNLSQMLDEHYGTAPIIIIDE